MNGIIVCELILGVVLMSLVFASLADTDLIADRSSKSKNMTRSDTFRAAAKPDLALTDLSPDVHEAKATDATPVLLASKQARTIDGAGRSASSLV
jgi:hypothetical protein